MLFLSLCELSVAFAAALRLFVYSFGLALRPQHADLNLIIPLKPSSLLPPPSLPQFDPHHQPAVRTCRMALRLLQAAFDPLQMQEGRTDRDLLTMIVHRRVDDEGAEEAKSLKELYDFSQFRTMLIKKVRMLGLALR